VHRGVAYLKLGQSDQAKKDLEKVISLNPDNATLVAYIRNLLSQIG